MKNKKENYRAEVILANVEKMIDRGVKMPIRLIYDELSIFDWWPENLTVSHLKQMRSFLKEAIKLGYNGYVCFKVGASGCANGMWAYKEDGKPDEKGYVYSPDGDAIYRSFSPDYTYWSYYKDGKWLPGDDNNYDSLKTAKMLEEALANA